MGRHVPFAILPSTRELCAKNPFVLQDAFEALVPCRANVCVILAGMVLNALSVQLAMGASTVTNFLVLQAGDVPMVCVLR
jgi:hypothetical protein